MRFYLLILLAPILLTACPREACDFQAYNFEIPATLSPAQEVYRIGDTITISSRFVNLVPERSTNQSYLLDSFNFRPIMILEKLDTDTQQLSTIDPLGFIDNSLFQFGPFFGSIESIYSGIYNYDGVAYDLEFRFVVQETGIYYLSFGSSVISNSQGSKYDFEGKMCPLKQIGGIGTRLNDGADNNVDLLLESPVAWYNTKTYDRRDQQFGGFHYQGGYCFRVEE